nr:uncharacterized protein LOC105106552 isoform X8 [Camelus dromedarius]
MLQDLQLAGLRVGPGPPQELVASGIAVGHLPVLQDDDTQKYHQEAVLGHAPLITLHPITGTRHRQSRKRRRRRRRRRRRTRRTGGMRPPPAQPPAAAHPPGPGRLLGPEGLPQPGGAHSSEPGT